MNLTSAIVITLVVVSCGVDISAKDNIQVVLKTYDCKILDSTLVLNYTCTLTRVLTKFNQTKVLRSQELNLRRGVKLYNFYVHLQLYRKFGDVFRPYLINIDQDLCALLGNDRTSKSVSLLRKLLKLESYATHGNYYDPCPFSGTRYERNVEMENNPIAMVGVYRMDITGYTTVNGIKMNVTFAQVSGTIRIKS